jgi:hypothetical protein
VSTADGWGFETVRKERSEIKGVVQEIASEGVLYDKAFEGN